MTLYKERTCFNDVAFEWLEYVKITRKPATYTKYLNVFNCYIRKSIGIKSISEISARDIDRLLNNLGHSSISIKKSIISVTNLILNFAKDNGYEGDIAKVKNNIIKNHSQERHIETLGRYEQKRLLEYVTTNVSPYNIGITFALVQGLRIGEICALTWEDIDFDNKVLHVRKTVQRLPSSESDKKTSLVITKPKSFSSERKIPISDLCLKLLKNTQKNTPYIIGGDFPCDPRTLQYNFKRTLKTLNIKSYKFHALRHTFATNCVEIGVDTKSLSELLGHSSVSITLNIYVHPSMELKRNHLNNLSSYFRRL